MKRGEMASPRSPAHKKPKLSDATGAGDHCEDDEGWTKVERRKGKKKNVMKLEMPIEDQNLKGSDPPPPHSAQSPRFMYSSGDLEKRSHAVTIEDIRDLVLHLAADAPPPNWLRIKHTRSVQKVVALLIPGLTPDILSLPTVPTSKPHLPVAIPVDKSGGSMPFIHNTFSHVCPTRAPGDKTRMHSLLGAFFQGPLSAAEKTKRMRERTTLEKASKKDPAQYVMSLEHMIEHDYPIPSYMADVFQKPPGWIETPEPPEGAKLNAAESNAKIYAIDCEMCLTEDGSELARICVVDYDSDVVVYDRHVKPSKPIIDYLTKWSGITPDSLVETTTTLADVQAHLLQMLSVTPVPILLGHSLESDLKALKLCHPQCIDTALIYHHSRGRPLKPGLAWLTKKWCGREIQTKGDGGHDPQEDAGACVELLKLKVENGFGFGEFKTDYESIFERMSRSGSVNGSQGIFRSAIVDHGNPGMMHGAKATTAVSCNSDQEVLEGLVQVVPGHDFAFGRFMELADTLGWMTPKDAQHLAPPPSTSAPIETLGPVLTALNEKLGALYATLPAHTALILFTGHDDPRWMAHLNARRNLFEHEIKSGKMLEQIPEENLWTTREGRELEDVVEKARRGLLFLAIKGIE